MNVTIRDVAKKAGVSPSTVSKVLNNSPLISQSTIDLVNRTIQELNYVPNYRARNFAKGENRSIAFITLFEPNMALMNPYIFEIFTGIEQVTKSKNYTLNYISANNIEDVLPLISRIIADKSSDGVILHGYTVTDEVINLLIEKKFPHILIGKPKNTSSASWLDINNTLAGELAIKFLADKGLKIFAFIGSRKNDFISEKRYRGIKQYALQHKLSFKPTHIKHGEPTIEDGYRLAKELLDSPEQPEGIICENSLSVIGVAKALRESNLRIPEDISFICFDNYPFSFMIDPLPTVVDMDMFSLGIEAGKSLFRTIKNPNLHIQGYITLPSILARNSTP